MYPLRAHARNDYTRPATDKRQTESGKAEEGEGTQPNAPLAFLWHAYTMRYMCLSLHHYRQFNGRNQVDCARAYAC